MKSRIKRYIPIFLTVLLLCMTISCTVQAAFPDVKSGIWYEEAVNEMEKTGWLVGYTDGTFRPNWIITTAEYVSIVVRCAGLSEGVGQVAHWGAGNLQTALDAGWYDWDEIPPTDKSRFDRAITRDLATKILMKALLPDAIGQYDYNTESQKIADFSSLSGRYYDTVLSAYAIGLMVGYPNGTFRPKGNLTRAEASLMIKKAIKMAGDQTPTTPDPPERPTTTVKGGVSQNGWLQVKGTQLCNEAGDPVALRGMSSHGIQWYSKYTNAQSIKNTADFGANIFRVAMYTAENGYISNQKTIKQQTINAVDAAIKNDMYVIIDWHILSDGNPKTYTTQANAFFAEIAQRYKDNPAVIYEICNEPNGNVTWAKDIKPYAEQIVKTIRTYAPKSIILIGSGTWSQDIQDPAANPVSGKNLMYTLHFYAGTHGSWLRDRVDDALKKGLPIFVSEWGTSAADGNGGVYLNESKTWLDFLDKRGISWTNWSLCDKGESSAALKSGTPNHRAWTTNDLTESGKFVFSRFSQ